MLSMLKLEAGIGILKNSEVFDENCFRDSHRFKKDFTKNAAENHEYDHLNFRTTSSKRKVGVFHRNFLVHRERYMSSHHFSTLPYSNPVCIRSND